MGRLDIKIKSFFSFLLDLISFGTPLAVMINLIAILLLCFLVPVSVIDSIPFECVFKSYIIPFIFNGNCPDAGLFAGCECPACGMTHAMHYILNGDFRSAWQISKISFAVIFFMIGLFFLNLKKFFKEKKRNKKNKK